MNRLATNIIPKLLCLALVLALPCAAQYGPAPTYVGIPSFMFTPAAQQQDEWCWAASIQMILNWYHIPVTQEMIVNQIKGGLFDAGGTDEEISRGLSTLASGADHRIHEIRSSTAQGPPPVPFLISELGQGHPILLTFATGPNSGHAVVITAASYVLTPMGPYIKSLVIRDPYPSPQNVQTMGRIEIGEQALVAFLPLVSRYWLVSVSLAQTSPVAGTVGGSVSSGSSERKSNDPPVLSLEETGDDSKPEAATSKRVTTPVLPNNTAVASEGPGLCFDLKTYVSAAATGFSSLKGSPDPGYKNGEAFTAKQNVAGFPGCRIWIYRQRDLGTEAECEMPPSGADFDGLYRSVKDCLGPSWSSRSQTTSSASSYVLRSQSGLTLTLQKFVKSGKVKMLIDKNE
jgi:hypothetical protein